VGVVRVVVADNDPDALDLALTDLGLEGHEVHGARDADSAQELVALLSPDVLVLDHRMPPGRSGMELAEELVAAGTTTRIVVYSNYQSPLLRSRAAEIGVPFLAKGNLHALRSAVTG
jgi:CheY-like chemotaxis protein